MLWVICVCGKLNQKCMFLVSNTHHLQANRNSFAFLKTYFFDFLAQSYMKGSMPLLCMSVQYSATARRWLALLTTGMERLCPKVNPPNITNLSLTLGKKANKVISPNVRLLLQRGPNSVQLAPTWRTTVVQVRPCLHRSCYRHLSDRTHTQSISVCTAEASVLSFVFISIYADCVFGSECSQNAADLHSILCLNACRHRGLKLLLQLC